MDFGFGNVPLSRDHVNRQITSNILRPPPSNEKKKIEEETKNQIHQQFVCVRWTFRKSWQISNSRRVVRTCRHLQLKTIVLLCFATSHQVITHIQNAYPFNNYCDSKHEQKHKKKKNPLKTDMKRNEFYLGRISHGLLNRIETKNKYELMATAQTLHMRLPFLKNMMRLIFRDFSVCFFIHRRHFLFKLLLQIFSISLVDCH